MDAWNVQLFSLLNAGPHLAGWPLQLAVFAAEELVFLVPLVLAACWLRGPPEQRNTLLMAFVAIVLALTVNVVISLVCYYPRPFMIPIGHTYLAHTADSSFPCDHGTVMFALGLALISRAAMRRIGGLVLLAACVTAWARIYLRVHFPLDMCFAGRCPVGITGRQPGGLDRSQHAASRRAALSKTVCASHPSGLGAALMEGWHAAVAG